MHARQDMRSYDFARFYDAERCEAYKQLLDTGLLSEGEVQRAVRYLQAMSGFQRSSACSMTVRMKRGVILENYENMEKRQLRKMTHIERFSYDVLGDMKEEECVLCLTTRTEDPLDHQAKVFCVTEEIRELCKQ